MWKKSRLSLLPLFLILTCSGPSFAQAKPSLSIADMTDPIYFTYQEALAASGEGDFDKAAEGLKEVLATNAAYSAAWRELGLLYLREDRPELAVDVSRKQLQINASDDSAYGSMGRAFERLQRWEDAIQSFEKEAGSDPESADAHSNLGLLFEKREDYKRAIPELQKATAILPKNTALLVALANSYCRTGQAQQCQSVLKDAAAVAETPANWNRLAWYMAVRGLNLDEALTYGQRAVDSTERSLNEARLEQIAWPDLERVRALASYWDTVGWIYFQRNDLPGAENYLVAAWRIRPDGIVGNHLGQLYEKLGRKKDAIHYYALSLGAGNPEEGTRDRLIALAGRDAVSDEQVARDRDEMASLSVSQIAHVPPVNASADFYVEFAPGRAPILRFICGTPLLRNSGETLGLAHYPVSFPDSQPSKLFRRASVLCTTQGTLCTVSLLAPSVAAREFPSNRKALEMLTDPMGVDFSPYISVLLADVKRNWYKFVPQVARAPQMKKGDVSIGFAVARDGKLTNLEILKSSRNLELDRAAFDAVLKIGSFPALPTAFTHPTVTFRLNFSYNPDRDSCAMDAANADAWLRQ